MKDLFYFWIIVQFVAIGLVMGEATYNTETFCQAELNEYNWHSKFSAGFFGGAIYMASFLPDVCEEES